MSQLQTLLASDDPWALPAACELMAGGNREAPDSEWLEPWLHLTAEQQRLLTEPDAFGRYSHHDFPACMCQPADGVEK